jgi:DNA-binding PadR family transcriptional regulator
MRNGGRDDMSKLILGEFEQIVLLTTLRLGSNAFGRMIFEEIERLSVTKVTITAVYVTLSRLEKKSYVSVQLTAREGEARPQKLFAVEAPGIEALQRSREQLARFWDGVEVGDGGPR